MLELIGDSRIRYPGGGATGILGAAVQRYADHKGRQLDLQAQASKQAHEVAGCVRRMLKIMAQEWAARTPATIEGETREVEADAKPWLRATRWSRSITAAASSRHAGRAGCWCCSMCCAGWCGLDLTIYLCVLTTQIYNELASQVGPLTADQR